MENSERNASEVRRSARATPRRANKARGSEARRGAPAEQICGLSRGNLTIERAIREGFNLARCARIIGFLEQLTVPSGFGQGEPLQLDDFQKEFVVNVYGPVNEKGKRRIREALLSIARKNGKSAFAAGLVLCHLVGPEAIPNGDVLSAATTKEQAAHIYKMASQMIRLDPELNQMCKCLDNTKRIVCYHNGNFYQSLAAEARQNHGGNPVFCIYDELAQAHDAELYGVLSTAFGGREEGLLLIISTQTNDPLHIMSEQCDRAFELEAGTLDDPYFYGKVYAVPEDANIYDEEVWKLANPALGKFKSLDHMRAVAKKARRNPAREAEFRNLELNQRVNGSHALLNSIDWRACQKPFDLEAVRELKCYGGLDLASRLDLCAFTLAWLQPDGECVATKSWFWTPERDLDERETRDGARYRQWAEEGWLRVLPGPTVSYIAVIEDIARIISGHLLEAIAYDRYHMPQFKLWMEQAGVAEETFKLIEHGQGFKDMAPAVNALESYVVEHKLHHDGNPIVTYCLSGVKVVLDPAGNRKFDKSKATRRIDGAVTLAMALHAAANAEKPEIKPPSVYLKRGMRVL
jgi:phage terminase large subunit-like protein